MSLPTSPADLSDPQPLPAEPGVAPVLEGESGAARTEQHGWSVRALFREIIETVILTVLIYVAVNFATGRFKVEGSSMEPSVHPNQYVLVDKISYRLSVPQRGDVVVFNYPLATERDFIKRIIGLPGETVAVSKGVVSVNGQRLEEPYIAAPAISTGTWQLGPHQYFVMGDNRNNSSDSRSWGPLEGQYLIGKAVLTYWPPTNWGLVPHFTYASPSK